MPENLYALFVVVASFGLAFVFGMVVAFVVLVGALIKQGIKK